MSKKYGIFQVGVFEEYDRNTGIISWFYEVGLKEYDLTRILASSYHEPYKAYSSREFAERGGLEWLHGFITRQLKGVEEALNTL